MSRSMLLVFLLLIFVITFQFELKQQFMSDIDSSLSLSPKQQHVLNREEVVKEKIILSQEKNIEKLSELVRSLKEQLQQCIAASNGNANSKNLSTFTEEVIELYKQQILED